MGYRIFDLELTQPLPCMRLEGHTGVALIMRRKGRVLGFLMNPWSAERELDQATLSGWIADEIRTQWIQQCLREELCGSVAGSILPRLTVAVCTKDRPDRLRRCLRSLLQLEQGNAPQQAAPEILVVDNAPSDSQSEHVVAEFPNVRYACEPRPGLNFARNRALHEATGELLAYFDDDVVVDRFWLRGLAEAWEANPDAGAITGQVLPLELETQAQILFERRGGFRHGFQRVRYTSSIPTDDDSFLYPCRTGIFGVGCNMAFRRQRLLEIGGFDEALDTGRPLPGGGDHDIFYRIVRAGHPLIYDAGCVVFHQHRQTLTQLHKQYWSWGQSVMAFASKSHGTDHELRRRWRKLIAAWFLSQFRRLPAAWIDRNELPARFVIAELIGGMVGICGEYKRSCRRVQKIRRQHA